MWTVVEAARAIRRLGEVRGFIGGLYGPDLHSKRVDALAGATLGVMTGASLAVAVIGQALAQARGLVTKHAVKQVDRLLSNAGIDVWDSFACWVPQQVGARPDILVAMDWTDFDLSSRSIGTRLELCPTFQGLAAGQPRGVCLCGVGRRGRLGDRHDPFGR